MPKWWRQRKTAGDRSGRLTEHGDVGGVVVLANVVDRRAQILPGVGRRQSVNL